MSVERCIGYASKSIEFQELGKNLSIISNASYQAGRIHLSYLYFCTLYGVLFSYTWQISSHLQEWKTSSSTDICTNTQALPQLDGRQGLLHFISLRVCGPVQAMAEPGVSILNHTNLDTAENICHLSIAFKTG